ncbi:MAG: hypothetical protein MUC87_02915 [Bacteroidia bacterium]|nr:hypothetical protein [Bacteroidia bacterium]
MKAIKLLLALICLGTAKNSFAQTVTCSPNATSVSVIDSTNHVINAGDTLCVLAEGGITGTITLNGGVLYNSGSINAAAIIFNSGTIVNNGTLTVPADLQLNANSHLSNQTEATVNVTGYFSVHHASASATNEGSINIQGNLLSASGSITNNGVINCNHNSAASHLSGNGTVNESSPN